MPAFGPDIYKEDEWAEEHCAPTRANSGHHPGAATVGDFMAVARRSKAKPRLMPLRRSGPRNDMESAHRGGPSASSSSTAPQPGEVARACERICGVPCNLRVAPDRTTQQNAAVDGAVLISQKEAA